MKIIGLILLPFFLLACSSSDGGSSNNGGGGTNLPDQIENKPLVAKAALTEDQKALVRSTLRKLALMPSADLYLPPHDETYEDKQERLEKIQKLSTEAKKIYDQIVAQCILNSGVPVKEGTAQAPPGSTFSEYVQSTASGANCVVNVVHTSQTNGVVLENNVDQVLKEYEQTGDKSVLDKLRNTIQIKTIVDQKHLHQSAAVTDVTGTTGMNLNASMDGILQLKIHQGSMIMNLHMKFVGEGTLALVDNSSIRMIMEGETLQKDELVQAYNSQTFIFPGFDFTVQIYENNESTRFYLNGDEISQKELEDLLGNYQGRLNLLHQNVKPAVSFLSL